MTVELLTFEDCPHAASARARLRSALARIGNPVPILEVATDGDSPTIRVDGIDILGATVSTARSCRLEIPTEEQILSALRRSAGVSR